MTGWFAALMVLGASILLTSAHILVALLRRVRLHKAGPGFEDLPEFSEAARRKLEANYQRMQGTLLYWKNRAALSERIYTYTILWNIESGVAIPVLLKEYDPGDIWARAFLTTLAAWNTVMIALNRSFKAEATHRGFRQTESDFYDLRRRLLDRPESFGTDENERLQRYFEAVERVRQAGRDVETDNYPSAELP